MLPQADDVSANGTLHLLAESAVGGYVALSFAANPGTMAPAEAVLGFIDASGPNVRTFYISQVGGCIEGWSALLGTREGSGAGLQTGDLSMDRERRTRVHLQSRITQIRITRHEQNPNARIAVRRNPCSDRHHVVVLSS